MIVNLSNEDDKAIQLKILFSKTPPGKRRQKQGRELIDTTCKIFDKLHESEASFDELAGMGIARQSFLDDYSKIVGKKIALTRALKKVYYLQSFGCSTQDAVIRRKMRQHIWNVFHATFKNWR